MEFVPICLECKNFKDGDKCPHYEEIPFAIKNREKRCDYYNGNITDYELFVNSNERGTEHGLPA